jgi:hypothetical protein
MGGAYPWGAAGEFAVCAVGRTGLDAADETGLNVGGGSWRDAAAATGMTGMGTLAAGAGSAVVAELRRS